MAALVNTLTKVTEGTLGRGFFAVFTLASDGGNYATGGVAFTPSLASFNRYRREPSYVIIEAPNGYKYEYDYTNKLMLIRAQKTGASNYDALIELQDSAAIAAGAQTGARVLAFWFTPVP